MSRKLLLLAKEIEIIGSGVQNFLLSCILCQIYLYFQKCLVSSHYYCVMTSLEPPVLPFLRGLQSTIHEHIQFASRCISIVRIYGHIVYYTNSCTDAVFQLRTVFSCFCSVNVIHSSIFHLFTASYQVHAYIWSCTELH